MLLFRSSLALDCNAERLQEIQILRRERLVPFLILCIRWLERSRRLLFHFVEPDGCFQHQENIESLLADVLNDSGNIFGFRDALVNSFAQLLDQLP